jgi:hypothetical protein
VSASADTYQFVLFRLSENTRAVGEVLNIAGLTPAADLDPLTCDATTCTLAVDAGIQALLTEGLYSWTVVATGVGGGTEASNAPFFFTVDTSPVELIVNGSFETAGAANKVPASWVTKNLTGDKRKCDDGLAADGVCSMLFKGSVGENSKLQQKPADVSKVVLGDTLTLSVQVNTTLAAAGKLVIVKVVYAEPTAGVNGDGIDTINVVLSAATTDYDTFTGTVVVDGTVTSIKVEIRNKNAAGKFRIDDISLVSSPAVGLIALPQ